MSRACTTDSINRRAGATLYQLATLLFRKADFVFVQCVLVSEYRLRRAQRKRYTRVQGHLDKYWMAYSAGEMTTSVHTVQQCLPMSIHYLIIPFSSRWRLVKSLLYRPTWHHLNSFPLKYTAANICQNTPMDTLLSTTLLKVYSNELFLFELTNDLCRSFTKLVIILFLSKAVLINELCYFNILC